MHAPVTSSYIGLGRDMRGRRSPSVDRLGDLHLFYGCDRKALRYARSERAWGITASKNLPAPTAKAA